MILEMIVIMIEITIINKIDLVHNSMIIMIVVMKIAIDNFNNKEIMLITKMMHIIPQVTEEVEI
jgi:hypothetical protein